MKRSVFIIRQNTVLRRCHPISNEAGCASQPLLPYCILLLLLPLKTKVDVDVSLQPLSDASTYQGKQRLAKNVASHF